MTLASNIDNPSHIEPFLKSVAEHLYRNNPNSLQDICLVFPNRRAGLFFSRHLATMIDNPIWMPPVRTIADLMKEISGYQTGDPLTLVFDLYKVYKEERKTAESFSDFYHWGEMLLADFDDIDKYLVDAKQLFRNIADLKDIDSMFELPEEQLAIIREFWKNIKLNEPGPVKEDFISVWKLLHNIYLKFGEVLRTKKVAYEGMMYRDVCRQIKTDDLLGLPFSRYAIIGFNALNECEKEFFKYLKKENIADFYWDYDDYYISNTWHEAGFFLRENLMMFPQPVGFAAKSNLTAPKNIDIISVPGDVGQAKIIPHILEQWGCCDTDLTKTSIVLADEQLLIPVLSSLPEFVPDVNVTLGYPLKYTPVFSFFEAVTAMHRNARTTSEGIVRFYHRDVSALLNHPYIQAICGKEANDILRDMITFNSVFLLTAELSRHSYLAQLFQIKKEAKGFLDYLVTIGSETAYLLNKDAEDASNAHFNREYWLAFITSLNRLCDIIVQEKLELEMQVLIRIIRKMTSGISIPFKGEPLKGLQLMGVLETRSLDFANVVLLSANEGVLPKSEAAMSFIPYNLRRGFGLPTIEHQDAIFAYYFYRLIQRADNVALVYNGQGNGRSGEMSRFLYQMKYEQAFQVNIRNQSFRVSLMNEQDITILKDEKVMKVLYRFTSAAKDPGYLTPTALNAYLDCTLRFYYRYIAQIREAEDITEDIEGSMFGKLLHYAMEQVYSRKIGDVHSKEDLDVIQKDKAFIEECILQAFAAEFFKKPGEKSVLHGKSLVVKEVLRKYIIRILEYDKELAPLVPVSFERQFQTYIQINNGLSVKIGGKIDRIDLVGQAFRVIDYKTGKVNYKFDGIDSLFEVNGKRKNKEALQILLYSLLVSGDDEFKDKTIIPGIYGLRDIFKKEFYHLIQIAKGPQVDRFDMVSEPYTEGLKRLLAHLFNPEEPFTKVADKKVCEFCDYRNICHR